MRTDGLDGETDWKLRLAVPCTQRLHAAPLAALSGAVATLQAARKLFAAATLGQIWPSQAPPIILGF